MYHTGKKSPCHLRVPTLLAGSGTATPEAAMNICGHLGKAWYDGSSTAKKSLD
ncbi:hypothetical protein MGG_17836 [Pyricularia oryzae 70-15]|uniref:Uncharacterized protein n=1 Tax=Pyricularia oryzae (strain 70-15 / ATCC MYA-4617 / FGSC 8958) TaxID=242507 RepID=G4NIG3_PYRO7|nr:uncharacterized protein MGG_17836 [Pyricularia oryzae 70-15]EHA48023.1 hypothetical protein MGG_17836 [Pyricularia oryzae 70-15]